MKNGTLLGEIFIFMNLHRHLNMCDYTWLREKHLWIAAEIVFECSSLVRCIIQHIDVIYLCPFSNSCMCRSMHIILKALFSTYFSFWPSPLFGLIYFSPSYFVCYFLVKFSHSYCPGLLLIFPLSSIVST